jgi:TolB-like protein
MGMRREFSGISVARKEGLKQNIRFESFSFNPDNGQLWQGQSEIRLTPKAAAVLRVLIANAGSPVSKDQLFSSVWRGTAVTDGALTSCIQELRKAFGDDARRPRYIETRHRLGYQFVAVLSAPAAVAGHSSEEILAIAVLPFADISPEHDQGYLCDGLAIELISALSGVHGLRVVSRTASFQFRETGGDIRSIGSQLGVGYLVEGSVRKTEARLRVIVQLVDVAAGYHRWSQQFDCTPEDVFAIQDEMAEGVANTLRSAERALQA